MVDSSLRVSEKTYREVVGVRSAIESITRKSVALDMAVFLASMFATTVKKDDFEKLVRDAEKKGLL